MYKKHNSFATRLQLKRNICLVIIWEVGGHCRQAGRGSLNVDMGQEQSHQIIEIHWDHETYFGKKKMFTHLQIPMIFNKTTAFPFISSKACDV